MENSKHEAWNSPAYGETIKKCRFMAILLAPFGIHKFLLGYTTEGICSGSH
jgi:TM2 domain-containing membrane protein YozV